MRLNLIGTVLVLNCICLFVAAVLPQRLQAKTETAVSKNLSFVENQGQVRDQYRNARTDIDFRISFPGMNITVGDGQLHYQWFESKGKKQSFGKGDDLSQLRKTTINAYRMDVILEGANMNAAILAAQQQEYFETYYTDLLDGAVAHSYRKITYQNIYPNIDWVLYIDNDRLKYDFVVHPGGDPRKIRMRYSGHTSLRLKDGGLTAATPMGSITENKPYAYNASNREEVPSAFLLSGSTVSFNVAPPQSADLVIDPVLSWSTYYGDFWIDAFYGMTANSSGDVFAAGFCTYAGIANLATTGAHQSTFIGSEADAMLVKFNSSGVRQWGTFYGGGENDIFNDVTLDNSGNIILTGVTVSTSGIATPGSHKSFGLNGGTQECFLVKFNSSGIRQWGTYYNSFTAIPGYLEVSSGQNVACDPWGYIYLAGGTGSINDIATPGAHQTTRPVAGPSNTFLVKFSPGGVRQWGTYFGHVPGGHRVPDVAVGKSGSVYLSGTASTNYNMSTTGSFQPSILGGTDMYLAKFDSSGVLKWGTFYGGAFNEAGGAVTCDTAENIYICGTTTNGMGLTTPGAFRSTGPTSDSDAIVVSFTDSGKRRWATLLGGPGGEAGLEIAWAAPDAIYIGGHASLTGGGSLNMLLGTPVPQSTHGGQDDGFVAKLADGGQHAVWGTYIGRQQHDKVHAVAYGGGNRVYVAGRTESPGMATAGAFQTTLGNSIASDGFLRLYSDCIVQALPALITGPDTVCENLPYTFSTTAMTGATTYAWQKSSFATQVSATGTSATYTFRQDTMAARIGISATSTCGNTAVRFKTIVVNKVEANPLQVLPDSVVCQNDSVRLSSLNLHYNYTWLRNDTLLAGAADSFLYAKTSGKYHLILTDNKGCADTSQAVNVLVNPLPVPVVTLQTGAVLTTDSFAAYQWYRDGNIDTGATYRSHTAIANGSYSVMVTDSNGCSAMSAAVTVSGVGIEDLTARGNIIVYPNPAQDALSIAGLREGNYIIVDALGRKVLADAIRTGSIDIKTLTAGNYMLLIVSKGGGTRGFKFRKE